MKTLTEHTESKDDPLGDKAMSRLLVLYVFLDLAIPTVVGLAFMRFVAGA